MVYTGVVYCVFIWLGGLDRNRTFLSLSGFDLFLSFSCPTFQMLRNQPEVGPMTLVKAFEILEAEGGLRNGLLNLGLDVGLGLGLGG